jgi:putative colanic acid biosynthesis acetyltransferase WcaF
MPNDRLRTAVQSDASASPWPAKVRAAVVLWAVLWGLLWRPTPRLLNGWRLALLRLFGAKISGRPYVDAKAFVKMPWNLRLGDRAALAPCSYVYNLALVEIGQRSTVAQYTYLCGGSHDLSVPSLPLVVGEIIIGADVFIGAKAFILPGVHVGDGAVVGACAVVTKDVPPWTVVVGNPAKAVGPRVVKEPFPSSPSSS